MESFLRCKVVLPVDVGESFCIDKRLSVSHGMLVSFSVHTDANVGRGINEAVGCEQDGVQN